MRSSYKVAKPGQLGIHGKGKSLTGRAYRWSPSLPPAAAGTTASKTSVLKILKKLRVLELRFEFEIICDAFR